MNKERRKQLDKAIAMLDEAKSIIESVRDEEQDAFDNMPESLQAGERGEKMESAISLMDEVIDEIDSSLDNLNEASA